MKKVSERGEYTPAKRRGKLTPAEAVRMLRELQEMTQVELAQASGVPQPVISAIENGSTSLGIDRAKKLARALKVHPGVIAFADWNDADTSANDRPTEARKRRAKSVA
jgi:transcriptional regulator with XRE-family HTH domain